MIGIGLAVGAAINYPCRPCIGHAVNTWAINVNGIIFHAAAAGAVTVVNVIHVNGSMGITFNIAAARPGNVPAVII